MSKSEKQMAALLAGTGVIPIKNEWVEELLNGGHVMFTEKAADGESDAEFMRRAFSKALQNESIVKSTKQCIIFNTPERHGKMSIDEIEQLSGYISKWSVGEAEYIMNWGLYEIPDSKRMKITIVANSPALAKTNEEVVERHDTPIALWRKKMMIYSVVIGLLFFALSIHFMGLGAMAHPAGLDFVGYLKFLIQMSYNRYDICSFLCWMIGGSALLYAVSTIKAVQRN